MRKYGPVVAMIGLLAVGAWLIWGFLPEPVPGRGTNRTTITMASSKSTLVYWKDARSGEWLFRILRRGHESPPFGRAEFERYFGDEMYRRLTVSPRSRILRFFKITSWTNLVWISIGLAGQVAFSGRMIYQWWASERLGESIVPLAFWWMSLGGGACLFSYFIWRQDFVGILGQAPGVVVYARNLWLIYRARSAPREARCPINTVPPP